MKYDVAIIGAGPAGLMAAGRAAELGARVILIEKNRQPGVKLLSTGGGRCNFTNAYEDMRLLAGVYGNEGKFLLSAFSRFGPKSAIEYFENRGVKTKTEFNSRVFPSSDRAQDILSALTGYLAKLGVEIRTLCEVRELKIEGDRILKLEVSGGDSVMAENYIIATGGKSYFKTGSTGDGYKWLRRSGHKVGETFPALSPLFVREKYVAELQGLSLKNVSVSLWVQGRRLIAKNGEMIFTRNGLSGPLALDLARTVARELPKEIKLAIDFRPETNFNDLEQELINRFRHGSNKAIKNFLVDFLPAKLIPVILRLCGVDPVKQVNVVTKAERQALAKSLKELILTVDSIGGYDFAMATSGGLDLREIDQKTMHSKIIGNLFVAGELLGIDGPTGGYNLQVCWSSGYVAGESAAKMSNLSQIE